jgi:hypothetical protein
MFVNTIDAQFIKAVGQSFYILDRYMNCVTTKPTFAFAPEAVDFWVLW